MIGGGVSGLAAASHLCATRPDLEIVVLERAPAAGGWLRTALAHQTLQLVGIDAGGA